MSQTIQVHPKCQELQERYYDRRDWVHAYAQYREAINGLLAEGMSVLDVGCGRSFPLAGRLLARTPHVFGIDPVADADAVPDGATVKKGVGEALSFGDGQFDLVVCQSVLEHVERPGEMFAEVARVLRAQGAFVVLTPSKFDYISLAAMAIPNRWHPRLVSRTEGRAERDTFPAFYHANTRRRLKKLARGVGLEVVRLEYLHHCPSYFMFSPVLYRLALLYDRVLCRRAWLDFLRGWLLGVFRKGGAL